MYQEVEALWQLEVLPWDVSEQLWLRLSLNNSQLENIVYCHINRFLAQRGLTPFGPLCFSIPDSVPAIWVSRLPENVFHLYPDNFLKI